MEGIEAMTNIINDNVGYYNQGPIQDRLFEFIHGWPEDGRKTHGARYFIGFGESEIWKGNEKAYWSSTEFSQIFEMTKQKGLDIFSSLWRDDGTMIVLDIEYFNLSFPGEVHAHPGKTFGKIEPVYHIIKKIFDEYGIPLLITMTGQGYHFTTIWPFEIEHKLLENIGALEYTVVKNAMRGGRQAKRLFRLCILIYL